MTISEQADELQQMDMPYTKEELEFFELPYTGKELPKIKGNNDTLKALCYISDADKERHKKGELKPENFFER